MRFIYTKAFGIFAACVALLALLVFMQAKGWLDPIRLAVLESPRPVVAAVEDVTLPVKDFFSVIYRLRSISQENTQLQQQVISLQQDLVQYQEENRENEALKKELGFAQTSTQPLVPCTVLSQNQFAPTDAFVLNCGSSQGVTVGQAVVSQGYLAGKIIYAGPDSSTALLATAGNFSTDARVSQTNATAIVTGSFGSGIILDQVPQNTDLEKGWLIVTAGINQSIPKGILIGQVGNIISGGSDLFKQAGLTSPIDFDNLNFVFVVKN